MKGMNYSPVITQLAANVQTLLCSKGRKITRTLAHDIEGIICKSQVRDMLQSGLLPNNCFFTSLTRKVCILNHNLVPVISMFAEKKVFQRKLVRLGVCHRLMK